MADSRDKDRLSQTQPSPRRSGDKAKRNLEEYFRTRDAAERAAFQARQHSRTAGPVQVVTGNPPPPRRQNRVVNAEPPPAVSQPVQVVTGTPPPAAARVPRPVTPGNTVNTPGARANRKALKQVALSNGNMSPARRLGVIKPALIKYGYSPEDAEKIAIAAPLSTSMYNDRAIAVALEYAESLSQPLPIGTPNVDQVQRGRIIPMPAAAKTALDEYRNSQVTVPNKARNAARRQSIAVFRAVARAIKPTTDKVGNLPVPGGLGMLFLVNLLFLFLIIPANSQGYTRAELLWLTLLNMTKLPNVPPKETIPASPIVQAAFGIATGIEETAVAVASLGQDAQNVVNAIQGPGQAVQKAIQNIPVIGGIVGAAAPIITGSVLSASSSSSTPPVTLDTTYIPPASAGGDGPPAPPPF